ncbi:MAG: hypothetical protein EBU46_01835 [Nitrosomonadaceae bacterium]|nr:hypothetical protein [Nitrosomonadaceae bacterium]
MIALMNEIAKSAESTHLANKDCMGMIKIWKFNPKTGEKALLKDVRNTIVYSGADILAYALAGKPNSAISHFYLGYNNNEAFNVNDVAAVTKSSTGMASTGDFGYIRVPLSFPASFSAESNYSHNTAFFTVMITNPPIPTGAEFGSSSKIYAAGLVVAGNPEGSNQDKLFSKAQFAPITYDPSFGLTITWGVKFTAE